MTPVLCVIGGCNGSGKTTLARDLLPLMRIRRFLNADEIARGLSPLDPALSAFHAGRLCIGEAWNLIHAGSSFAFESTLSGKSHARLLRAAKVRGYRVVLHYILIDSADQAVRRVTLRAQYGGHNVPERDVRRRFERSRRHFVERYLPLADAWALWDNALPPHQRVADSGTHRIEDIPAMLTPSKIQETPSPSASEMVRLGLEASRLATARMCDFYRRMDIEVTPQMTLASPDPLQDGAENRGSGPVSTTSPCASHPLHW